MNSITIVGFVGADPEQRQARNNGSRFTVLSVATQRSWKNAEDEWVSKVEWHRIAIIWNLRSRLSSATGRSCRNGDQERHACPRRGRTRQQHLRAPERQEQEVGDDQDHVLVHSR